ncbi:unnamed protein product, partial [Symbiodinium sp. CCMP2456]
SLHLRTQLEVRSFVCAGEADQEAAAAVPASAVAGEGASAVRYLSASREQREKAPSGMISVLSYSIADAFNDSSPLGVQRQSKVKRQVLVYHTDLICLQGVDVSKKNGASLASTLTEEGSSGQDPTATIRALCFKAKDVVQQFPCFRLPVVAAFDWLRPQGLNKCMGV